jgi:hypothetical protein
MHFVVAVAVYTDACRNGVEVGNLVGRQRHAGCTCIFFQPFTAPGARDRDDPWVQGEQSRQCHLPGGGAFGLGELGDMVDEGLVGGAVGGAEARDSRPRR